LELFETFADDGRPAGLVRRDEVHRRGLWHQSAQAFLFNSVGDLLLQHRAHDKDLYADLWDYSVGEHLQPGETFAEGASRGLDEELGVIDVSLVPLGDVRRVDFVGSGVADREIQQAFAGVYNGSVQIDEMEVQASHWIARDELLAWLHRDASVFTPWFAQDIEELGLRERWGEVVASL